MCGSASQPLPDRIPTRQGSHWDTLRLGALNWAGTRAGRARHNSNIANVADCRKPNRPNTAVVPVRCLAPTWSVVPQFSSIAIRASRGRSTCSEDSCGDGFFLSQRHTNCCYPITSFQPVRVLTPRWHEHTQCIAIDRQAPGTGCDRPTVAHRSFNPFRAGTHPAM